MNNKKLAIIAGKGDLVQNLIYKSQKIDFDLTVISIDNPELKCDNNYKLYKLNNIDIDLENKYFLTKRGKRFLRITDIIKNVFNINESYKY